MFAQFGLVLMVNHACNLRCSYCYTGDKFQRSMSEEIGQRSIDRALASLSRGGRLELGFFGGEPLIESRLIESLLDYAAERSRAREIGLSSGVTTNGTITDPVSLALLERADLDVTVSFDGVPSIHDRHRLTVDGRGTAGRVEATIRRLLSQRETVRVLMVVRPDTLEHVPAGIEHIRNLGVRRIDLSVDLWARWVIADVDRLEQVVVQCASLWRDALPELSINWFDEKAAQLARVPMSSSARCGFGAGEVAVAPSGALYPCERLIGEDRADNPMRLLGHALEGGDFLSLRAAAERSDEQCDSCALQSLCSTTCRCSNYVRTGDVRHPDGLLCRWNQACFDATAAALAGLELSRSITWMIRWTNLCFRTPTSRPTKPARPRRGGSHRSGPSSSAPRPRRWLWWGEASSS